MAFSSDVVEKTVFGNKRVARGTYTSTGGSTGGNIDTGLATCEQLTLQPKGSAVVASAPVVNETLPVAGDAVTIVTTANEVGYWEAVGK